MKKLLFVCHGNICRSPMAEFILKDILKKNNIDDVTVSSSATSTEEIWNGIGNSVYPPAKRELEKHGISCQGLALPITTINFYIKSVPSYPFPAKKSYCVILKYYILRHIRPIS